MKSFIPWRVILLLGLGLQAVAASSIVTVWVTMTRTTTSTVYRTSTDVRLTGTFAATYNIVEITNMKGQLPLFFMTVYADVETFQDTWGPPSTITTTTEVIGGMQARELE